MHTSNFVGMLTNGIFNVSWLPDKIKYVGMLTNGIFKVSRLPDNLSYSAIARALNLEPLDIPI